MDNQADLEDLATPPARRGRSAGRAAEARPEAQPPCGPTAGDSRTRAHQRVCAANATVALTDAAPSAAPTTPSGVECSCMIAEHRSAEPNQAMGNASAVTRKWKSDSKTPEDLLDTVRALRHGRKLTEILAQRGERFLASAPIFRTIRHSLSFHGAGRDLVAELRDIHACTRDARRPVLMTAGIYGTGKTVLLLRALDAIPQDSTLDMARMYITFAFTTRDRLEPGGRACFNAALLLRAFHAALTTLGLDGSFTKFLEAADWKKFVDVAKYLPLLADALGVQTLAIAVDRIAGGVRDQAPSRANLEAQTVAQLCDIFRWADIKRLQQAAASGGVEDEAATAAAVIPILSCMYPRYARAAQKLDDDRPLVWLQTDLAPSVDEIVERLSPPSRSATRLCELFYRQQYAACSGHFRLCAEVYTRVDKNISPSWLRSALKLEVDMLVDCLTLEPCGRKACDRALTTMVAQAVSGMTFKELQERHGAAAAPLDPFFQSDTTASNLPLAVVLSPRVSNGDNYWQTPRPLREAFGLWREAADSALQQSSAKGMCEAFDAMIVHGLALRWAAFLTPAPPTPRRPTPLPPSPSVGFCAGRGAHLDPAGNLCWVELSDVAVCELCTYTRGTAGTFPPPGGILRNSYTLTPASATNPGVVGGGCATVSFLPPPFEGLSHVYFTVHSHQFGSYAQTLEHLVPVMPNDGPCVHMFWTPRPFAPKPSALEALLRKLRSSRGDGAAASGPCLDIVACVNVQDCFTPSLAWTLTCAGFDAAPGVTAPHS